MCIRDSVICDYFVYNDRTQMYESWEQEKYKASHDSLTGLLNRDQFYDCLLYTSFDGLIQAYVFVFLTGLLIKAATE